jgi:hypothetical protein
VALDLADEVDARQADGRLPTGSVGAPGPRPGLRQRVILETICVLAVLGATGGVLIHQHSADTAAAPPTTPIGRTLHPLAIHRQFPTARTPGPGQVALQEIRHPSTSVVVAKHATIDLHAQFALVREVGADWQVSIFAPKEAFFARPRNGVFYDAELGGRVMDLLPIVDAAPNQANFTFILGQDEALAFQIARALTTSVVAAPSSLT